MFSFTKWHRLPLHDRVKICTHFGLKKGSTVVFNGQHGSTIQSDGYNLAEVEKMFENIYDLYPETHDFDETSCPFLFTKGHFQGL